jgi:Flp pilus assembly protein TadG
LNPRRADDRGTTAIEFAMVAAPFFLFAFAIMGIGLQFFTINALEHGVEAAARQIRTGQMQGGKSDGDGGTVPNTIQDFKNLVCSEAGSYISGELDESNNCTNDKLVLHISSGASWSDVSATPCLDADGNLTAMDAEAGDDINSKTGGSSQVVLVTACYQWDLGGDFWNAFWNLLVTGPWSNHDKTRSEKHGDKVVIQAVSTFRTEPYN